MALVLSSPTVSRPSQTFCRPVRVGMEHPVGKGAKVVALATADGAPVPFALLADTR